MKNLKKIIQFFFILSLGVFNYSCSYDEQISEKAEIQQAENFVDINDASKIASLIAHPLSLNEKGGQLAAKGVTSSFKEVEEILVVPDNEGNPSLYIINYKDNGFIMISADNRINPIRAYSSTEKFPMDSDGLPSGLLSWLAESSDMISQIRTLNEQQTEEISKTWNPEEIQKIIESENTSDTIKASKMPVEEGPGSCSNQYTTVGPLLSTVWGQRGAYNDLAPNIGCSGDGRAPTGCVATAMAQIMKFHQYPSNYNWSNMPDVGGTTDTALIMRDIGDAVNMDWGCNGSSANTEDEAGSSFRNDFGYSSASYADFNRDTVKQQLRWNRPVILRGGRESGWWIFSTYADGHAWVCDGYRSSTIYSEDCSMGWGYLYLHMNWGWSSAQLNGWYAFNNWNPDSHTFNYKRGMVYNIKP